jgi:PAS domain S-box-containing protein
MVPQLPPLGSLPSTLEQALQRSDECRIITEPNEPYRIVHVNEELCRVCGYDAEESLGRTCRILQGLGTCKATLGMLSQALMLKRNFAVQLLNYTKRGRPFMNTLQVTPLFSSQGHVTHYLGVVMARFLDAGNAIPPSIHMHPQHAPPPMLPMMESHSHDDYCRDFQTTQEEEDDMEMDLPQLSEDSSGSGSGSVMGRVPPFLTKLSEILSSEPESVVKLSPESAAFCVMDASKFAKEILPRYFKHNKLGSFSQQLHTYGFRRKAAQEQVEFYHDRYNGDPAHFLGWIRSGGALSKRAAHTRSTPMEEAAPPIGLMHDLMQIQEGTHQLALMFQQAKSTHALQLRTILMKLMLRGILAPESVSYISSLPPTTPIMPRSGYSERPLPMPPTNVSSMMNFSGCSGLRSVSVDGLQAHLDALEAGLAPLFGGAFPMDQMPSSNMSSIDLQVRVLAPLPRQCPLRSMRGSLRAVH